jgi:hypothetical protein
MTARDDTGDPETTWLPVLSGRPHSSVCEPFDGNRDGNAVNAGPLRACPAPSAFIKAAPTPAEAGNGLAGLGVKEDEYLKDGERNWQGSPSGASWALSAVVAAVLAAVSSTLWMCTATWTPASQ